LREVEKLAGCYCGPQGVLALMPPGAEAWREEPAETAAGVSNGVAGSLLGLDLLAPELDEDFVRRGRATLLRCILARLHVAEAGLACVCPFDAIQPPLGFFGGGAGVRHVLNHHAGGGGWGWIRAEMLRYEEAAFSPVTGNWKDFLNEAFFNSAKNASALNRAAVRGDSTLFERHGDAIGWGAGTAGIMLGHLGGPETDPVADASRGQALRRGWTKIRSVLGRRDPADDRFTLYDGWGGVALSLMHCLADRPDAEMEEGVHTIVRRALAQHRRHGRFRTRAWNEASALSLLEGEAGIGYFLLKAVDGAAGGSVLYPVPPPESRGENGFTPAHARRAILRNALPLTERLLADVDVALPSVASSVGFVAAAADGVGALRTDLARDVFDFEKTRLTLRAATRSNLYLASREAHREEVRTTLFAQADDAAILRGRFRLVPEARLGLLPFALPAADGELPQAGRSTAILLHARSDGLREIVLTPTACGVLVCLSRVKSAHALLKRGRREWPLSEYDDDEARRQVIATIRSGLADGYLEPARG
jgi:hypothetical protein